MKDSNKSFQDMLDESLKDIAKGIDNDKGNAAQERTLSDSNRGRDGENSTNNREAQGQSRSTSFYREGDSTAYYGSTNQILQERSRRSREEGRRSGTEVERGEVRIARDISIGTQERNTHTRSIAIQGTSQDIQEIHSAQTRLSTSELIAFQSLQTQNNELQEIHSKLTQTKALKAYESTQSQDIKQTEINTDTQQDISNRDDTESLKQQEMKEMQKILSQESREYKLALTPLHKNNHANSIKKYLESTLEKYKEFKDLYPKTCKIANEILQKHEKSKSQSNDKNKGRGM